MSELPHAHRVQHVMDRARERYGVELDKMGVYDLDEAAKDGIVMAAYLDRGGLPVERRVFRHAGTTFMAICYADTKRIMTLLPPNERPAKNRRHPRKVRKYKRSSFPKGVKFKRPRERRPLIEDHGETYE